LEGGLAPADAPAILTILGIGLLGPALIHHGSEAQRRRFIPPMLSGDEIWCQGFSEPGAVSALAALQTAARLDGDHVVLNGQKVWTTFGPWADWIFVLARTDAKDRYGGISFLLVKLDTPGVTVRPLRQITGESEFGEVFFEDARVPRENLVGQIGEGWRIAMTVLGYERGVGSLVNSARYGHDLARLAAACKELGRTGTAVREKLGRLLVENEVMRANGIRALANLAALRRSTRDFLARACPFEASRRTMGHEPRGYDPALWQGLAEMGYLGLTVPARAGGHGLGTVELAIVLEEMGRSCLPGPYLDV